MARNREETLAAIRETANEQVPYNVQGVCRSSLTVPTQLTVPTPTHYEQYLDEFSKSLANEVRMLLNEVGKLREEKRNVQL